MSFTYYLEYDFWDYAVPNSMTTVQMRKGDEIPAEVLAVFSGPEAFVAGDRPSARAVEDEPEGFASSERESGAQVASSHTKNVEDRK